MIKTKKIKSLILGIILIGTACCVNADEGKELQPDEAKQALVNEETKTHATAQAVMSLKIEALKWKKSFYAQKSEAMQLKYMVQCWNDPDFQEVQRIGRETDKELKRILILQ